MFRKLFSGTSVDECLASLLKNVMYMHEAISALQNQRARFRDTRTDLSELGSCEAAGRASSFVPVLRLPTLCPFFG